MSAEIQETWFSATQGAVLSLSALIYQLPDGLRPGEQNPLEHALPGERMESALGAEARRRCYDFSGPAAVAPEVLFDRRWALTLLEEYELLKPCLTGSGNGLRCAGEVAEEAGQ